MMGFYHSPSLVTNGLVLCLDAGNPKSYPGSGATWFDISGQNNHMTLTGSPSLVSNNGGVLSFNGSTQYGTLSGLNYSTTSFTIMAGTRYSGATRNRVISSVANNWLLGHWQSRCDAYFAEGWINQGGTVNDTNWRIYSATENYSGDQRSFYINNTAVAINSTGGSAGFNGLSVARSGVYTAEISTCEVSFVHVYNRILSASEMEQNFNALRSRYGI